MKSRKEAREYRDMIVREEAYSRQVWQIVQSVVSLYSDISQDGQEVLRHLDQARRDYQSAIFEASKIGTKVCCECGVCCCVKNEKESRYHAVDFWLRRYTDNPVPNQDEIQIEHPIMVLPRSFYRTILREIRDPVGNIYYFVRAMRIIREAIRRREPLERKIERKKTGYNPIPEKWISCMYLTDHGCILDACDRPISCIVHTCYDFLQALDIQSLKAIVEHLKGLRKVHYDVLRTLKKEGKLGYLSGLTRLAIPVLPFGAPNIKHLRRLL